MYYLPKMKNRFFIILLSCVGLLAGAQNSSKIGSVPHSGHYRIDLSPAVIAGCRENFEDLRIISANGAQTPYFVAPCAVERRWQNFVPYPIKISKIGSQTEVVVEVGHTTIRSLEVEIKNAQSEKRATLSGSDDAAKWYVVKDVISINGTGYNENTTQIETIDFPLSKYRYYRLAIDDSTSAPLYIVAVGYQKQDSHTSLTRVDVAASNSTISNKDKHTNIQLCYDARYPISRVELFVSAPQYFNRTLDLTAANGQLKRYTIGALKPVSLSVGIRSDTLNLSIYNGDDRPLVIDSIKSYLDRRYVIAWLDSNMDYRVTFGDKRIKAPVYDLSFVSHLPDTLPSISTDVVVTAEVSAQRELEDSFLDTWGSYIMWVIIALVIAQILYMVARITRKHAG